mmetsp:Transcript_6192/g.38518  ORF Transcript_6192/g.38518 Transcript_6192/m.38518 type:complete len:96 (-) Transcript_6192:415-702(-)
MHDGYESQRLNVNLTSVVVVPVSTDTLQNRGRSGGSLDEKSTLFFIERIHVAITACTTTTSAIHALHCLPRWQLALRDATNARGLKIAVCSLYAS